MVVVRGQEELAPIADVVAQEVPQRAQLADVVARLRVLKISSVQLLSLIHI